MKKVSLTGKTKAFLFLLSAIMFNTALQAQEKVNVNGHDVGTWFGNNWMWVAGAIVLLLLLLLFSGGSSRRKTTTVVKDNYGDVKRVTTTEEVE